MGVTLDVSHYDMRVQEGSAEEATQAQEGVSNRRLEKSCIMSCFMFLPPSAVTVEC